jgi:hypothetical protein
LINSAILFLIFNRPNEAKRVFEIIRDLKPKKLYVVADGPRNKVEEIQCSLARKVIEVDWECEVLTRFNKNNLGCKLNVSSAIDWFFQNEEQGIILEDDVIPTKDFFIYCDELLEKYKDDERIGGISGVNFVPNLVKGIDASYFFSNHIHIWGWATWRRVWSKYDVEMRGWTATKESRKELELNIGGWKNRSYWGRIFDATSSGKINTWDYQLVYMFYRNNYLSITPKYNLVENIGFNGLATHTSGGKPKHVVEMQTLETILPLVHPASVEQNKSADMAVSQIVFSTTILEELYVNIKSRITKWMI